MVDGSLDLAILITSDLPPALEGAQLLREEMLMVVGEEHPLRGAGAVSRRVHPLLLLLLGGRVFASRNLVRSGLDPRAGGRRVTRRRALIAVALRCHV